MSNVDLFQIKAFALVDKKSKIRGTTRYDINVTCI